MEDVSDRNESDVGPGRRRVFTEEEIVVALRRAADVAGEPLSAARYTRVRESVSGPSAARLIQRYQSWAAACRAAGVESGAARRGGYSRRWTEAELLEWVARYLRSESATGSYADFADWSSQVRGAPSPQTVRNTLGRWVEVKRRASDPAADGGQ